MIHKIALEKLRNSEVLQFLRDAISIADKNNPEQLQIAPKLDVLKAETTKLAELFNTNSGSEFKTQVLEADQRRDKAIIGLRTCIEGYTYHFTEATSLAAQALLESIDKFGSGIARINLEAETSTLNAILSSWVANTKLAEALVTLNLTTWATELKAANEQFNAIYISRTGEKAAAPQEVVSNYRKTAAEAYRAFVRNIDARAELDSNKTFVTLANELSTLVDRYSAIAASHAKPKNNETQAKG